jgi:hypothetical protein
MKKVFFPLFVFLLACFTGFAQLNRPKLVVGIVVDQMRPDYLTRFYEHFGNGGFKTLMSDGYTMWNIQFNYIPTYTGLGHASIYSGTTPRYHGIIGNDIYYREKKQTENCVRDTFAIVGNTTQKSIWGASPVRFVVTNICDELKLCTNKRSKIFSMSMKDRAAILPAGHLADYALWFDQETGNFVTSTWYAKQLPDWLVKFNDRKLATGYIKEEWNPLYGRDIYNNCDIDTAIYAITGTGKKILPLFPHNLRLPENSKNPEYSPLYNSPFANSLLTDLAIETIKSGELGKGQFPDFLAISYSGTDAVGHLFGPQSKEIMDTYLRLDKDLERLIQTLDQNIGKDNYVLFLTADHGVAEIPRYLMKLKGPAGYIYRDTLQKLVSGFLDHKLTPGKWIEKFINDQFYLNRELISEKGLDLKTVQTQLAEFLIRHKGIAFTYTASALLEEEFTANMAMRVQNGFQPKRSGDVLIVFESGYSGYGDGYLADHGSGYNYDTNVPLIWYGQNIKKGESWQLHYITDLAPTLSMILRIKYPSACIGNPMLEINERK